MTRGLAVDSMERLALLRSIKGGRQVPTPSLSQGPALPRTMVSPTGLMETPAPVWVTGGLTGTGQQVEVGLGGEENWGPGPSLTEDLHPLKRPGSGLLDSSEGRKDPWAGPGPALGLSGDFGSPGGHQHTAGQGRHHADHLN